MSERALYKLPLVFEPQPEGGYTVTCPVLPDLVTEGDTVAEALTNVTDAVARWSKRMKTWAGRC